MSFGVNDDGFNRPSYADIRDNMLEDAREVFGPDHNLGKFSTVGMTLRATAFALFTLWAGLKVVYDNFAIRKATGQSLDFATDYIGIDRLPAQPADGYVTFHGNSGVTIPAGTRIGDENDSSFPIFRTTAEATVQSRGEVDVPAEAIEPGDQGNVGAGAISSILEPVSGVDDVDNNQRDQTITIGESANTTSSVTVGKTQANTYQVIDVSDIHHDLRVTGLEWDVENTSGSTQSYRIRVRILDDDSGEVIKDLGNQVYSKADGVHTLTFDGFTANVREADNIRIEFYLKDDSDGSLDFVFDTSDNYSGGDFVLNGTTQSGQDLVLDLTSEIPGDFSNGRDQETDTELRERYFASLARSGAGTLASMEGEVSTVDGVQAVNLEENITDSTVNGLPPHSFRATVLGGINRDVAQAILSTKPAGIEDVGTTSVTVEDENQNIRTVKFRRPTEVTIVYEVTITTNDQFPSDGVAQVEDELIDYVGGTLNTGEEVAGLGISEDVIHTQSISICFDVDGVEDVDLELKKKNGTLGTANLSIGSNEVAKTSPGNVTVTVS